MFRTSAFIQWRQLVLRQFTGDIVRQSVGRDEFCSLLLSRRPLERCNDEATQSRSLFDPCTGELFDIRESDLFACG